MSKYSGHSHANLVGIPGRHSHEDGADEASGSKAKRCTTYTTLTGMLGI